jgi:hypothetical protein
VSAPRIVLQPMSTVRRRAIRWLPGHEGYIPLGMLTLLAGRQGLGKSLYGHLLAAELTGAGDHVLIASAEEPAAEMIRPRLEAAGANLDYVKRMTLAGSSNDAAGLKLPENAPELRDAIIDAGPRLVILDPIGAYVGGNIDSWKGDSVRRVMNPLSAIVEEAGCAFLLVGHLNKGSGDYLARVMGSTAWTATVRSALLFSDDPDEPDAGRRLLSLGKTNIAPHGTPSRVYAIREVHLPADAGGAAVSAPRRELVGDSDATPDEALRSSSTAGDTLREACEFLRTMLADGPAPRAALISAAAGDGISADKLKRAAKRVGVISTLSGFPSRATWSIPSGLYVP